MGQTNNLPQQQVNLNFGKGNLNELNQKTEKEYNLKKQTPNNSSIQIKRQKQQSLVEFDSERSSYKGTVGQIHINTQYGSQPGSGALISHNGRYLLLTCAHNLFQLIYHQNRQSVEVVEEASFHYQQTEFNSSLMSSKLKDFKHVERYNEFYQIWDGFDLATAVIENEAKLRMLRQNNKSDWSFYERLNLKVGETIVLIGYPKRPDGKCFEMEGTILDIKQSKTDDGKVLIAYDDIITEEGQNGSPVFLKRGDQYTIIGVHIGTIQEFGKEPYNFATAITIDIYNWIIDSFEKLK